MPGATNSPVGSAIGPVKLAHCRVGFAAVLVAVNRTPKIAPSTGVKFWLDSTATLAATPADVPHMALPQIGRVRAPRWPLMDVTPAVPDPPVTSTLPDESGFWPLTDRTADANASAAFAASSAASSAAFWALLADTLALLAAAWASATATLISANV